MSSWIEEFIEEPIRPAVKLLRDNGFNTTCSCGHDMEIELDLLFDGELKRLHDLLYNNGFRDYEIVVTFRVERGLPWFNNCSIKFNPKVPHERKIS
jgi:hypothetical protein